MTESMSPLKDWHLASAVSHIVHRSERQPNIGLLATTYVDTGILTQLANRNNQILYGRRGTGKSHVLRVLANGATADPHTMPVYIDLRNLGSAQLMTDSSKPVASRCIAVFRDLLAEIQQNMLDFATDPQRKAGAAGLEQVSAFADAVRAVASVVNQKQVTVAHTASARNDKTTAINIGVKAVGVEARSTKDRTIEARAEEQYEQIFSEDIVFAEVSHLAAEALSELHIRHLLLILDEWTAMPGDVQPYVAEFLKRIFLPMPRVTVKIAALEYRSTFSLPLPTNNLIGFELGGDMAAKVDIDDYYTYEQGPAAAAEPLAEMLYRHVRAGLPENYLVASCGVVDRSSLVNWLFASDAAFRELVLAGSGVVRDFLEIFTSAFFRAMRHGGQNIDSMAVRDGARDYFELDKASNLSQAQEAVLDRLSAHVFGQHQTHLFAVDRAAWRHPMLQSLFDRRVIHLAMRGYTPPSRPGVRHYVYSLDYAIFANSAQPVPIQPVSGTSIRSDVDNPISVEPQPTDVVLLERQTIDAWVASY